MVAAAGIRAEEREGVPAYSRFVNRGLGGLLGAAAHVAGMTPNGVTVKISSLHLAILVGMYRFTDLDDGWLLVPIGYIVVAAGLLLRTDPQRTAAEEPGARPRRCHHRRPDAPLACCRC